MQRIKMWSENWLLKWEWNTMCTIFQWQKRIICRFHCEKMFQQSYEDIINGKTIDWRSLANFLSIFCCSAIFFFSSSWNSSSWVFQTIKKKLRNIMYAVHICAHKNTTISVSFVVYENHVLRVNISLCTCKYFLLLKYLFSCYFFCSALCVGAATLLLHFHILFETLCCFHFIHSTQNMLNKMLKYCVAPFIFRVLR